MTMEPGKEIMTSRESWATMVRATSPSLVLVENHQKFSTEEERYQAKRKGHSRGF